MQQAMAISELKTSSVVFGDGREESVDTIVLCTGYLYSFPFLHPLCHVTIGKAGVTPLYKHIIHTSLHAAAI